ncbi:MAG: hypothetical protein OEV73_06760 [Desulfobulbaceae bacterium]|nr:hypothetical protein [Desulfobulbaceae bacterium]
MHNSQNNADMKTLSLLSWATPSGSLTLGGCVGCHTGTNAGGDSGSGVIPYVLDTVDPSAKSLAGGNFFWVNQADDAAKHKLGHNVAGISDPDVNMLDLEPPGFDDVAPPANWNTQLQCAGSWGCHGDRTKGEPFDAISGAHHGADATIDGGSTASSYRFLKGILGTEDDDWQWETAADVNIYKGTARTDETDTGDTPKTISSLCGQCHGKFHNGVGNINTSADLTTAWLRHPTDYDFKSIGGEYGSYVENPSVPVAHVDLGNTSADKIVMCLSCHKAHGTQHDDLLRWSYSTMDAHGGAGNIGCFACHTTKDNV